MVVVVVGPTETAAGQRAVKRAIGQLERGVTRGCGGVALGRDPLGAAATAIVRLTYEAACAHPALQHKAGGERSWGRVSCSGRRRRGGVAHSLASPNHPPPAATPNSSGARAAALLRRSSRAVAGH